MIISASPCSFWISVKAMYKSGWFFPSHRWNRLCHPIGGIVGLCSVIQGGFGLIPLLREVARRYCFSAPVSGRRLNISGGNAVSLVLRSWAGGCSGWSLVFRFIWPITSSAEHSSWFGACACGDSFGSFNLSDWFAISWYCCDGSSFTCFRPCLSAVPVYLGILLRYARLHVYESVQYQLLIFNFSH